MAHRSTACRDRERCGAAQAWGWLLTVLLLVLPFASAHAQESDSTKADTVSAQKQQPSDTGAVANPRISISMDKLSDIAIELYPKEAPKGVERILTLVKSGFYNGLKFHRVESYVVQTGQAESDLPPVEGEMFSEKLTHEEGMVGMARLPDDYDSARTQFYICKKHLPLMNGEYTLIGKVIEGMEIVHKIKKGDAVKSITVVK
jgi:cyclophilin family peptidyl-prolyl cis-trans isomerase